MLHPENINLGELAEALEFNFMNFEKFLWLDPTTGKIELWGEGASDEAEAEGWDLDDRGGIRIDPVDSREGFRDMEEFTGTVQNPQVQDPLIRALNHSKPFRNFKDELNRHPQLSEQWYAFHDAAMKVRAIEWLRDYDQVEDAEAEAALALLRAEAQQP